VEENSTITLTSNMSCIRQRDRQTPV